MSGLHRYLFNMAWSGLWTKTLLRHREVRLTRLKETILMNRFAKLSKLVALLLIKNFSLNVDFKFEISVAGYLCVYLLQESGRLQEILNFVLLTVFTTYVKTNPLNFFTDISGRTWKNTFGPLLTMDTPVPKVLW